MYKEAFGLQYLEYRYQCIRTTSVQRVTVYEYSYRYIHTSSTLNITHVPVPWRYSTTVPYVHYTRYVSLQVYEYILNSIIRTYAHIFITVHIIKAHHFDTLYQVLEKLVHV